MYKRQQYPFVLDPFIPRAGTPLGMGMAEIGRSTQSYIDRLDYLIEENALIAGRQRFLVKNGAGVDEGALADLSRNFIGCDLSVDDNAVRPLQAAPLPGFVQAHRDQKIAELKDVLGNKDFMTGGVAGGVTADVYKRQGPGIAATLALFAGDLLGHGDEKVDVVLGQVQIFGHGFEVVVEVAVFALPPHEIAGGELQDVYKRQAFGITAQ